MGRAMTSSPVGPPGSAHEARLSIIPSWSGPPVLDDLPVLDAHCVYHIDAHLLSRGRLSHHRAEIGATRGKTRPDHVPDGGRVPCAHAAVSQRQTAPECKEAINPWLYPQGFWKRICRIPSIGADNRRELLRESRAQAGPDSVSGPQGSVLPERWGGKVTVNAKIGEGNLGMPDGGPPTTCRAKRKRGGSPQNRSKSSIEPVRGADSESDDDYDNDDYDCSLLRVPHSSR